MSAPKGKPGTGWVVTGQAEEWKISDTGRAEEGKTVSFRTQYGATGSVWLPRMTYTAETVRAAITATATEMDTVHILTG